MSDSPTGTPSPELPPETPLGPSQVHHHWFHKVSAILFIIFCLEVGLFLIIFPWTEKWDDNLFATFLSTAVPHWSDYWQSTYVRGAMSGIGLIDLYICFTEIFRLRRFSGQ